VPPQEIGKMIKQKSETVGARGHSCARVTSKFKQIDIFGQEFEMKVHKNDTQYRSIMGAFCTVMTGIFMLSFCLTKLQTLLQRSDVDIMEANHENNIDEDDPFSYQDGFFVAAALTEFNNDPEPVERPEYGELHIEHYGWGNDNADFAVGSNQIKSHECSEAELGIDENDPEGTDEE